MLLDASVAVIVTGLPFPVASFKVTSPVAGSTSALEVLLLL